MIKDLFNYEHRWKLKDWMEGKIDFQSLGFNCRGHYLIECNPEKSEWRYLSQHQDALYLLEKNPDKIGWYSLVNYEWAYFLSKKYPAKYDSKFLNKSLYSFSYAIKYIEDKIKYNIEEVHWENVSRNSATIHILKEHKDKIVWSYLAMNSNPEVTDLIKDEIENILNNPKDDKYRMFWYCFVGNDRNPRAKEIFLEYIDRIKDPNMKRIVERKDKEFLPYFEKKIKEHIENKGINVMDTNDFDLMRLSSNPVAVDLLLKYKQIINWNYFSLNPNPKAIEYLKNNPEKINWSFFVENRSNEAMEYVKEKVLNNELPNSSFKALSCNPYIFELDYEFFYNRINIIRKELLEKTWHPNRFIKWCLDIDELKDFV